MKGGAQSLMAWLEHRVDDFIPDRLSSDRELRNRVRMFLISHLLGPFIGLTVPAALFAFDPTPGFEVAILSIGIAAFWVFPPILRAGGEYDALVQLSVFNLNFVIFWSCYHYGGVSSPTLPWVLIIPILALFYSGPDPKLRLWVLLISTASFIFFFTVYAINDPEMGDMPLAALQGLGIVSIVGASLYVAMMAFYYASIFAAGVELETEARRHLATAARLRRATGDADRAGAAKAEFLARMSHELRTPLNAVIGYSQLLHEDAILEGDGDTATDLEKIHDAGQHLLRLINGVLDLSKIEAGKMELCERATTLDDVLSGLVERFRGSASDEGNAIDFRVEDNVGLLHCDPVRLRQALDPLVDNAIRHTKDGRVTVSARRSGHGSRARLLLSVEDTGAGIPQAELPYIFDSFSADHAADASQSTRRDGYGQTGLGLTLCREICRIMGGVVSVDSQFGKGTRFTICLPYVPASEEAEPTCALAS